MPAAELLTIASLSRLLQPLIKDLYGIGKKAGIRGLRRWEQLSFPSRLAKQIKAIDQVRTIWKPEGPISLQEFFHPPKVIVDKTPTRISRISDLPGNATIIEGIVGQGKSVLLRSLAIEELTHNDGKWLPMLIELKDLSPKIDLRNALIKQFDAYGVDGDNETLDYLLGSGKFALLLDGFDELEDSIIKETHLEIEHLSKKFSELRIVVTSRPGNEIQKSTNFQTLKIAQLNQSEYSAFLDRLGVDSKKSLDLRQAIKDSPTRISDLITTPLMLTLVVLVYESEAEIPETLPDFFESLFQVVFTKHDRQKANFNRKHKSGLSERNLQKIFENFSFMTLQSGHARTLTGMQFEKIFEMARGIEEIKCEPNDFRHDITKSACLMLEEGLDQITFLHKSLLEYFAAAFVRRLSDENAQEFYEMAAEKYRPWQEVLVFLNSIDSIRYSRYYILPTVERHRKIIIRPCANVDDKELIKLISNLCQTMSAFYSKENGKNEFEIRAMMGGLPIEGDEIGNFSHLMMSRAYEKIPHHTRDLIDEFGPVDLSTDQVNRIEVKAFPIFNKLGAIEIRDALAIFEARINDAEAQANTIINKEEKKKLLFLKKKNDL